MPLCWRNAWLGKDLKIEKEFFILYNLTTNYLPRINFPARMLANDWLMMGLTGKGFT